MTTSEVAVRVSAGVTLCDQDEQLLRTARTRLVRQIDALDRERAYLDELLKQSTTESESATNVHN